MEVSHCKITHINVHCIITYTVLFFSRVSGKLQPWPVRRPCTAGETPRPLRHPPPGARKPCTDSFPKLRRTTASPNCTGKGRSAVLTFAEMAVLVWPRCNIRRGTLWNGGKSTLTPSRSTVIDVLKFRCLPLVFLLYDYFSWHNHFAQKNYYNMSTQKE